MNLEKENQQADETEIKRDDSKDPITIDYFDRINHRWIKVETTKEVARFMKADSQKRRRAQNQYNYKTLPFDEVFDNENEDDDYDNPNEKFLSDPSCLTMEQEEELRMELAELEQQQVLFENALVCLTDDQRECVEMVFYKKMTHQEIADLRGLTDKTSVYKMIKRATNRIKKYIENTQN